MSENLLIDSTVIRSHPCATGAKGGMNQALGRSVGGFTTKIYAVSDGLEKPLDFTLTSGETHDFNEALPLLQDKQGERVIGDRSYDCNDLITRIKE